MVPPATTVPPPPNPRALLAAAGLSAKKSWGQNFLVDQGVLADIAALAAAPGARVLELGAGLGALTHHLLARGASVTAVERDRDLAPLLRRALAWAEGRLEVLEADAARLDYASLAGRAGAPLCVAGNLPYQISSRILVSLADARPHVARAVLLVQREVADRLTAAPGTRIYGLLSVLVQRHLASRFARAVAPGAFVPRPRVQSAVVVLTARPEARSAAGDHALVATARAAFQGRRKMLRAALAGAWGRPAAALEGAFAEAGVSPEARAETLSVDDFARLGAALAARGLIGGDLPG